MMPWERGISEHVGDEPANLLLRQKKKSRNINNSVQLACGFRLEEALSERPVELKLSSNIVNKTLYIYISQRGGCDICGHLVFPIDRNKRELHSGTQMHSKCLKSC